MLKPFGVLLFTVSCAWWATAQGAEFAQCLAALQERARAQHLPAPIIENVLAKLQPQPRVLELDHAQPEFTQTFGDYLSARLTPGRVERGRTLRGEYRRFLSKVTARYGVPGRYLIAFWGLESNFGDNLGTLPTLDSLATLACDERRSEYFTGELMDALLLLDRESLTPAEMHGSWAGAVGNTQFMPSAYRKYAVDGDHDGHINLWTSPRDALASGANFLASLGWRRGERWGREVLLPDHFPYAESGLANRRPIRYWARLGVTRTDRRALPDADLQAAIVLPAGHAGPAFLVYPNFDVIMGWNHSALYALSVGLLADRIAGGGELARPPPAGEAALSRATILHLQARLNQLGFDAGTPDGVIGAATEAALRAFQQASGIIADGYPDHATLRALAVDSAPSS